jgi:hypothetical protein
MSNKTYDILKYIALYGLPALATLILALGMIWSIPYTEQIAATITAIDTFLGALLGISSREYRKAQNAINEAEEYLSKEVGSDGSEKL